MAKIYRVFVKNKPWALDYNLLPGICCVLETDRQRVMVTFYMSLQLDVEINAEVKNNLLAEALRSLVAWHSASTWQAAFEQNELIFIDKCRFLSSRYLYFFEFDFPHTYTLAYWAWLFFHLWVWIRSSSSEEKVIRSYVCGFETSPRWIQECLDRLYG